MAIEADGRRVALLARPGLARERLSGVLQEAGANCVMAADPTQLKPEDLLQVQAQVVLVALDPLTEEALDQFDDVLSDRSVEVIYEEAEHAASREGWDAARWQRHLVAKLQGHSNVLPPSGGSNTGHSSTTVSAAADLSAPVDLSEEFGLPGAVGIDAAVSVETAEPDDSAATSGAIDTGDTPDRFDVPETVAPIAANPFDPVSAELEGFATEADFGSSAWTVTESSFPELSIADKDASGSSELTHTLSDLEIPETDQAQAPHPVPTDGGFDAFDFTLYSDAAPEPATGTADAAGAGVFDHFEALDFDSPDAEVADDAPAPAVEVEELDTAPHAAFSLQDDALDMSALETPESRDNFRRDLVELEQRISSMSLVDDTPRRGPERARGAVLILGGLGGPDAVRQLLGAMPVGFARPVLVQQRLEGGRYDRLVTQLQRATKLTVMLAEPEHVAEPGTVYILPDTVGATSAEDGIRFSGDAMDAVMDALPSSDSAVLLLSGSDPAVVDAAMVHSRAGALVVGQSADGCYDASAPSALIARGGDVAAPAALALRLSARWPNQGTSNVQ